METNLKNIMSLLSLLDEVIIAEIFDQIHTYKSIEKKQYIPYIDKMLKDSNFKYKSYTSFTIHYYAYSDQFHVCIIGRFSEKFNISLKHMFSTLIKPNDIILQSSILNWIFDAIPEVIAFKDTNGYFRYVTKDGDALYKRFDTLVNKHYTEIYSDQSNNQIEFLDEEAYKQKGKVKRTIDIETDFGLRTYESTRTPLYDSLNNPLGIISINRDITDSNELKSQFEFVISIQETLIEIANSFIDMNNSQFSLVINEALKKIGKVISADRCYIFRYFFEENKMNNAFEWCNTGIKPEIDNLQNQPIDDYLEDWVQLHRNHQNVIIDDVSKLDKNAPLYSILTSQSIKSLFTMPIFTDDECYGFIGFDSVKQHRNWRDIPILIKILPNLIGNLFSRFYLYKMLYDANEQNKQIIHNNQKTVSALQKQFIRPLKEIRSLTNAEINKEELLYQIDLIESTIENMTVSSNRDTLHSSSFSNISLEEILIRIIKNNAKYSAQNNDRLFLNYDYRINSTLSSNESKLTIVIDTIIKHLVDTFPNMAITIASMLLSDNDPYQKIKIGATIGTKKVLKSIQKSLSIVNVILKEFDSEIETHSSDEATEVFFIMTFYTPKKSITLTDMSKKIAFIDLTINDSSNVIDQIKSLYSNITMLTPQSKKTLLNHDYDIVFIHTNNPDYYSSNAKTLMSNFNENTMKILLYEKEYSIVYDNSFIYYNYIHSIPVLTSELEKKKPQVKSKLTNIKSDDKSSILILEKNKELFKTIKKDYQKMNINFYQFMTSSDVESLNLSNVKIIFIDEYLPLEKGINALEKLRNMSFYNDTHIYLISSNLEDKGHKEVLNSKTHLIQKTYQKDMIKNIINHHLFDEPLNKIEYSSEIKIFNQEQFRAFYPKIENQNIMKNMLLPKFKKLYTELNENYQINLKKSQTQIEELAIQMHTDKLRTYITKYNLTEESKDVIISLLKETIDTIQKTISNLI